MIKNTNTHQNLFLQGFSVEEFKELITDLIEDQLGRKMGTIVEIGGSHSSQKFSKVKQPNEVYLTRGEVAHQLQISLPTLHNYVKQGFIKSYRIGGKVRFKQEEINDSLTERNFTSINRKGGNHAS